MFLGQNFRDTFTVWDAAFISAQIALTANLGTSSDDVMSAWIGEAATTMLGGEGNDNYFVGSSTHLVQENVNQGYDRVESTVDYALGANLEQLTLAGNAVRGAGNQLDNRLFGNDGANVLSGEAGADSLYGGAGDDYLEGGSGDDVLEGGEGANVYSLKLGAGHDKIHLSGSRDGIVFGAGIVASSVIASRTPEGMLLRYGTAGDEVLVTGGTLRDLQFADGSRMSTAELFASQGGYQVTGNSQPAALVDTSYWARNFADGQGNNVMLGGGTDTTYHFNVGDGADSLLDLGGEDTLSFGSGISSDDIWFSSEPYSEGPLLKVHYGAGDVISIAKGGQGSIEVVNSYVRWYNEKRIKISLGSLGSLSPIEYRESLGLTT